MCGRGRFAILAACELDPYASNAQGCREAGSSSTDSTENGPSTDDIKHESKEAEVALKTEFPTIQNLSPGMECPVLFRCTDESGKNSSLKVENMVWGIIPTYLTSPTISDHYRMFNKRIESLELSSIAPYFKHVLLSKRCIAVFDGFYEWKLVAGKKHPHYVTFNQSSGDSCSSSSGNRKPLIMAGIYEDSNVFDITTGGTRKIKSFSIITTDACSKFRPLHDRQPAFLSDQQTTRWLDSNLSHDEVFQLLMEIKNNPTNPALPMNKALTYYPVTLNVTNPRYQEKDCSELKSIGTNLSAFFKPGKRDAGAAIESKDIELQVHPSTSGSGGSSGGNSAGEINNDKTQFKNKKRSAEDEDDIGQEQHSKSQAASKKYESDAFAGAKDHANASPANIKRDLPTTAGSPAHKKTKTDDTEKSSKVKKKDVFMPFNLKCCDAHCALF